MQSATYLPQLFTVAVLSTVAVANAPDLFPLDRQFVAVSLNGQSFSANSPTLIVKHDPNTHTLMGAGVAGCNYWNGQVNLERTQFGVGSLGSTKKYCSDELATEASFLSALQSVTRWSRNGSTLVLEGNQTKLLLAPAPANKL